MQDMTDNRNVLVTLTADIVAAHVSHNPVSVSDVSVLITQVHDVLATLSRPVPVATPAPVPAVSIKASVKPDHIVCLEDGKKLKMLKRHLMTRYNMTPDAYRAKWNLPPSYPMVAPGYAAQRKDLALKIGLGRKRKAEPAPVAKPATKPTEAAPSRRKSLRPAPVTAE